uniref:hypothetical protein n=1 Tax=Dysosmobacter welbionis TaxID=2093857 RepID=UPI00307B7C32
YGTIYGTGSTMIKGSPGQTQIDVNMSTGDQSKFTFVLSGSEAAGDYDFITFTNSGKQNTKIGELQADSIVIKNNARMMENSKIQNSSALNLNLQIEATNQAQMNLIMDKSTGDMIKATGQGSILRGGLDDGDLPGLSVAGGVAPLDTFRFDAVIAHGVCSFRLDEDDFGDEKTAFVPKKNFETKAVRLPRYHSNCAVLTARRPFWGPATPLP